MADHPDRADRDRLRRALAVNSEPKYTANARVIFDPERLKIIDLDNVTITPDTTTTGLQNQIEILRSAVLMERVVDILRLQDTPEFNDDIRPGPPPLWSGRSILPRVWRIG